MGNIHLVTGHAGKAHVTAADHGSLNAAIFGEGQYVLNRGSKFATTIISNNSIRVADGDIVMQGRHIRLDEGTYIDLAVENGSQGMYRNDLIVARYTKDSVSGIEDCNLVVIKGTAKSENATDPEYTSGDIINDHVLVSEMPLYRIPLDGLNVKTLVPLFELSPSFGDSINNAQRNIESHIANTNNPHDVTVEQIGATSMDLLWENASTTSEFAVQTLKLGLNDYSMYVVITQTSTSTSNAVSEIQKVGAHMRINSVAQSGSTTTIDSRLIDYVADVGSLKFYDCRSNGNVNNSKLIPQRIYGLKGVTK